MSVLIRMFIKYVFIITKHVITVFIIVDYVLVHVIINTSSIVQV